MITSPSKLPLAVTQIEGQVAFRSPQEHLLWCKDFINLAKQKLQDTIRWKKRSLLRNINDLTYAEKERLISALNLKTYFLRADKARKKGWTGMMHARGLLMDYNRLLDSFFEGRLRPEHKRTIQEILNE